MRTSAAGSKGFTLLEMLLATTIVAVASAGVALSLRDTSAARLETEAQRLAALLDAGRAQSRASGVPVRWRATPNGFVFEGASLPRDWTQSGIAVNAEATLLLGPEPVISAQSVRVWQLDQPQLGLRISTDGVRPFAIERNAPQN